MHPAALLMVSGLVFQASTPPPATDAVAEAYFLFIQSRRLEEQGDASGAISVLRRAVTLLPKAAEVHAELAGVFAREGRAADAVTSAESALAIDPNNREAHRILGFVQSAVAESPASAASAGSLVAQAILHLEQALAIPVSDPGAQLLLGRLYGQTGQHEKAVATLKAFLLDQPGYPEALVMLGEAAEHAGRWEEAVDAWGQVVELGSRGRTYQGRYAAALVNLGDQYFQLKRYKDAADLFDRALVGDRAGLDAAEVARKRDRARELAGK